MMRWHGVRCISLAVWRLPDRIIDVDIPGLTEREPDLHLATGGGSMVCRKLTFSVLPGQPESAVGSSGKNPVSANSCPSPRAAFWCLVHQIRGGSSSVTPDDSSVGNRALYPYLARSAGEFHFRFFGVS